MSDGGIPIPIVLGPDAQMPNYATDGAAGMDVCVTQDINLDPGERMLAPTGLRVAIPQGFELQIRPRSGLAIKHGISMVNSPGTIDSDFRGEIHVILINHGADVVSLRKGERIAQMVLARVERAVWHPVEELDQTERGEGGFGSTGRT